MSVVYKQSYKSRSNFKTPMLNAKHLYYIACRIGVVPNHGSGFGLWGRINDELGIADIDNLKEAGDIVRAASKEHTVYRAIISLDEDTARAKGFVCRDAWQELTQSRVSAIAKQNNIELKDFRWCAAYHHKLGHPHVHIIFWDASDKIREEYMADERFEIAAEKIRADFNKDIFKEELRDLRESQDGANKELRARSRNLVAGFTDLRFFENDTDENYRDYAEFYPENFSLAQAKLLNTHLERLLYLLPESGRLSYQLLKPNVKAAVDEVSRIILSETSLNAVQEKLLDTAAEIARTYGNSDAEIEAQRSFAQKRIFKDIGNDVLKTIKELDLLNMRRDERREELQRTVRQEMYTAADEVIAAVVSGEMDLPENLDFQSLVAALPDNYTSKRVVLEDERIMEILKALTTVCMNDERLKNAIKASQAHYTRNHHAGHDDKTSKSENGQTVEQAAAAMPEPAAQDTGAGEQPQATPPEAEKSEIDVNTSWNEDFELLETLISKVQEPEASAEEAATGSPMGEPAEQPEESPEDAQAATDSEKKPKTDTEEFKAISKYIFNQLYKAATLEKGWEPQMYHYDAVDFMHTFCRMFSSNSCINQNSTSRFLLLRELSKQAKKERAIKMQDSSNMWECQI